MVVDTSFPDTESLSRGLCAVLGESVRVIARKPNAHASTFPSEVVTCDCFGHGRLDLFCKYADEHVKHRFGHRSGVAFEAMVYRDVLRPLNTSTPRYYGQYDDPESGQTWLVLECLDGRTQLHKSRDLKRNIIEAARWAARFHRANEQRAPSFETALHRYDAAYYAGWAQRTCEFAGDCGRTFPWLATLCEAFVVLAPTLAASSPTIVHGEYYQNNILAIEERICPVDWETAGVAIGEVDLASLTEKWNTELVTACEQVYRQTRWNGAPSPDFERRLSAARLYLHFRWLGNRREWTVHEKRRWRFEQMRLEGERLGLL